MDVLNALQATRRIAQRYEGYLLSTYGPRNDPLRADFELALRSQVQLTRGPFLEASPPFEDGKSLRDLIAEGVLSQELAALDPAVFPIDRPLRKHQEIAIERAVAHRRNLVVASGTGSGKTECYLLPIIDHLLRERAAGSLRKPGVRALLLYPMNALANDQVKRLRRLLAPFSDLTFGRYVGETPQDQRRAEAEFVARYPLEPRLPNELLSRERMQASPPHILLTNFAMLEYLLLRPADSPLFDSPSGGHWRFVVLDEAHVYNGAQGAEIAMLLRRVRERVLAGERGRWQCFATSATLGRGAEDYPQLIDFATKLFDEPFEFTGEANRQDVIEARRLSLVRGTADHELPEQLFGTLRQLFRTDPVGCGAAIVDAVRAVGVRMPEAAKTWEGARVLARILHRDRRVLALQEELEQGTKDVAELSRVLFPERGQEALVDLVDLGVSARERPEDAPALPARYHFFARSLNGAFLCLHPAHPKDQLRVKLTRHEHCPDCAPTNQSAMFELGTCRRCRSAYLIGELEDGTNKFQLTSRSGARQRFLLLDKVAEMDDEDETALEVEAGVDWLQQYLCPGCGAVLESSEASCECRPIPARRVVTLLRPSPRTGQLHRCAACGSRTTGEIVARTETGSDAPVAVIATDLYQELPASSDEAQRRKLGAGRKLLSFADSRQDAAFFAAYLERTYSRSVRRQLIADAVVRLRAEHPRFEDLLLPIRKSAEEHLILDPDASPAANNAEVASWLMQEVLSFDRRTNLEGTGTADIHVAVPSIFRPPQLLTGLGFTDAEATDLVLLLLQTLRESGAVTTPDRVDIRDEVFAPRNRQFGVRLAGAERGVLAWMPAEHTSNRRLSLLERIFKAKGFEVDARALLHQAWEHLTSETGPWKKVLPSVNEKNAGVLWRVAFEWLAFDAATRDRVPWRCGRCQQVWWRTVAGVCPSMHCDGKLAAVDDPSLLARDHYARLYRDLAPIGMAVQEHTAQFGAAEASRIQDAFMAGELNVLSCSTTFELGVDVGDVQAVLLRNVPPSPANYVQRAGRAGRRTGAAALVVTFAQRRSHDQTFYADPRRMIDGRIAPPRIVLDNAAIVRRHVHSVAFAAFERMTGGHRTVQDMFEVVDDTGQSAATKFEEWLRSRPQAVKLALQRILPGEAVSDLELESWGWVDALFDARLSDPTFGWFTRAKEEVSDDLASIGELVKAAVAKEDFRQAEKLDRVRKTLAGRNLLGYLASRNVIPKYGFPVDVVELNLGRTGDAQAAKLDLTRDLSLAIAEYAPGGQVVAGKALWQSVGLAKRRDREWPKYEWAICKECHCFRHRLEEVSKACELCGCDEAERKGQFLMPIFGFMGRRAKTGVGESRPQRLSHVETFFGAYKGGAPEWRVTDGVGGGRMVRHRVSRQGRITMVNMGPLGRGFRICESCGFGELPPAPSSPSAKARKAQAHAPHDDPRMPGRTCSGPMVHRQIGHEFLTDTLEIAIGMPMTDVQARSMLYALLEGVRALDIERDEVNGTLHFADRVTPSIVLFDIVPGGAGHAQRMAHSLPELFTAAFERVRECECGEETSCYNCLRSYSNQIFHEVLSRRAAQSVLGPLTGYEP